MGRTSRLKSAAWAAAITRGWPASAAAPPERRSFAVPTTAPHIVVAMTTRAPPEMALRLLSGVFWNKDLNIISKNFRASTLALLRDDRGFSDTSSLRVTEHMPDYHAESMSGRLQISSSQWTGQGSCGRRPGQGIDGASTAAARSLRGLNLSASA